MFRHPCVLISKQITYQLKHSNPQQIAYELPHLDCLVTSVPKSLKARVLVDEFDPMVLQDANMDFDINSVKSRHFYKLLLSKKSKLPNVSNRLINDFDVEDTFDKVYLLPHNVASETYVWSFQYRLLNYILFTNIKLFKMYLLESK